MLMDVIPAIFGHVKVRSPRLLQTYTFIKMVTFSARCYIGFERQSNRDFEPPAQKQ